MAIYTDAGSRFVQFENENGLRRYPFADWASLTDSNGRELPLDVISDFRVAVPMEDGASEVPVVKLTSIHLSQSMVSACFKCERTSGVCALSVTVSTASFKPYFPYRLEKLAGTEDAGGIVSFGDMTFPGFPYTYFLDAEIHPCCVSASKPAGLRRITDERSGISVSGDVEMSFSGYVDVKKDGNAFSLSLVDGAAQELSSQCEKLKGDVCGAVPIRSINGVAPDEDGNIVLWFH